MAKKKASNKNIIFLVAAVLGVLAIVMYFLPMLTYKLEVSALGLTGYNKVDFNGFNLAFGAKEISGVTYNNITNSTTKYSYESEVKMAVGPLIAAICSLVGIVALVLTKVVGKKNQMLVKIVACVAFVAAAVLVVAITKSTFVSANEISENGAKYYNLAFGAYIVCACNGLAGIASLAA